MNLNLMITTLINKSNLNLLIIIRVLNKSNSNSLTFDPIRYGFNLNLICIFVLPHVNGKLINIHFDSFGDIGGQK